jgi:hypothetical protein
MCLDVNISYKDNGMRLPEAQLSSVRHNGRL